MKKNPFRHAAPGVFRVAPEALTVLSRFASELGYRFFQADFAQFASRGAVLRALGKVLRFPPDYGNNLDALHDCLSDPEWPEPRASGTVIYLQGISELVAAALIDVFESVVAQRCAAGQAQNSGQALWILLAGEALRSGSGQTPLPRLP